MKKILFNLQKLSLSALMGFAFLFAIGNINVACCGLSYQPTPPKSLERYKHFTQE